MAQFNTPAGRIDVAEAFNDCVDRLVSGASVDDCLRLYPHFAAILRPMLETALSVHQAAPSTPLGAKARVRARVMQAAAVSTPAARRRPAVIPWGTRVVYAAAAIVVAVLAGFLLTRQDDSPRGGVSVVPIATGSITPLASPSVIPFTETPIQTNTPAPTLTAAASPTATPTLTATTSLTLTVAVCTLRVEATSINLRSGPGTGYNIVTYGYAGDEYVVLARHTSGEWLEIQVRLERVWAATLVGTLSGACDALPVSTMVLKDAPVPTVETGMTEIPDGDAGEDGGSTPPPGEDDSSDDGEDDSGDDHSGKSTDEPDDEGED